jgi:hypothetical protein
MPNAVPETNIHFFDLKIDGAAPSPKLLEDILEIVVENSMNVSDMCTIRIHDAEFQWIDATTFDLGKTIEVGFGHEKNSVKTVFEGEVVGQEMDLSGSEGVPTIVIRAFHAVHRLHRNRKTRTFLDQRDSDIVKKVCGEVGLLVSADGTTETHKWVIQDNRTDWEFLMRVFRPRVLGSQQTLLVKVRGWDPVGKQEIMAEVRTPMGENKIGLGSNAGALSAKAFGDAEITVVNHPIHSIGEAKLIAQSVLDEISGEFVEAEFVTRGWRAFSIMSEPSRQFVDGLEQLWRLAELH